MYIPSVNKWVQYYEDMAKGYQNPFTHQKGGQVKQIGGSLSGSQGPYIIPIEETSKTTDSKQSNPIKVDLISPSQQIVEQAKSELQNKSLKRKNTSNFTSVPKRRRTVKTSRRIQNKSRRKTKTTRYIKGKKSFKKTRSKTRQTSKSRKTIKRQTLKSKRINKIKRKKTLKNISKTPRFRDILSDDNGSV